MKTRRSDGLLQISVGRHPLCLLPLLLGLAVGCESPTRADPPAPSVPSGTYSLFAMDGYPTAWFCTVWVDPAVGAVLGETEAYFFMYVSATISFRPEAGEVDIKHRLVSCGGELTESIEVNYHGSFEQRESLVLITRSAGAETYTDTARLRGDTLFLHALSIRKSDQTWGSAVLAYRRDP